MHWIPILKHLAYLLSRDVLSPMPFGGPNTRSSSLFRIRRSEAVTSALTANNLETQYDQRHFMTLSPLIQTLSTLSNNSSEQIPLGNASKNTSGPDLPEPADHNSEELLREIIDLAVRLWLMIDVGKLQHGLIPGHLKQFIVRT